MVKPLPFIVMPFRRMLCLTVMFAGVIFFSAASPGQAATEIKAVTSPFVRADDALDHLRLDPKGRFAAFVRSGGRGLAMIDLQTKQIFDVTPAQVGASFFWSPDGYRIFYRELSLDEKNEPKSVIKAYDAYLNRSVKLDELPYATGFLTFDPRDLRMHLMSPAGIRTKRIYFPDERLARWQVSQRNESGKWLATQKGMLWVTQGGYAMRRLADDDSGLESFDISPDGNTVAWATSKGRIYVSKKGHDPSFLAWGRDPRWHPKRPLLVFAGARMVGDVATGYDIKIADLNGASRLLTSTQFSDERWPQWHPDGQQIMYTLSKTTDLFLIDFQQE